VELAVERRRHVRQARVHVRGKFSARRIRRERVAEVEKVRLLRIKKGTGLVFQGERKRPYGLVMVLKPRASCSTGVYANRPESTMWSALLGELLCVF
jgi:hypothetical protein